MKLQATTLRTVALLGVAVAIAAAFTPDEAGAQSAPAAAAGSAASYLSAPSLHPPNVTVDAGRAAKDGGLFFIDPFASSAKPIVGQPGELILDARGETVWFNPVPEGEQAVDFRAQSYLGKPVLTWWQGTIAIPPKYTNVPAGSPEPGARFYVYDDHYRPLKTIVAQGEGWIADLHEFLLTPNGNAVFIAAKAVPMNLTPYGGAAGGAVEDSAIQEVNLKTGKLVSEWDMLQHVPLSEAQVPAPPRGVWDPFHMNSIEVLPHGRYLISARNAWAIYEIDAKSGKILWQLGGKGSSFALSPEASFYWQHDARLLPGEEVSLFDDGCCNIGPKGVEPPEQEAHGLVLKLDSSSHTATVAREYKHVPPLHVASQGSSQTLPDGNVLVGWGQLPYYSEFSASGKLLYDVALPEADESYRAFRQPWVGAPRSRPSVVAIRDGSRTRVYVSWNGATQVAHWQVLGGRSAKHLKTLASGSDRGFETAITVRSKGSLIQVKALDSRGRVIGTSTVVHAGAKAVASPASSAAFAGASVGNQTVVIRSGGVAVKVSCPRATYKHCEVKLALETARAVKVGARSGILTLGTGSAVIAAGGSGLVHVRLSSAALKAIRADRGKLTPNAIAVSHDGHGRGATRSQKITVREAGARKGPEEPSSLY